MIVIPLIMLILSVSNYFRLSDREAIRPIHAVSLLAIGALTAVVIINVVRLLRTKPDR